MKILIVNKFCPLHPRAGGAEKNILEIFSRIGERHEVVLLSALFPGAPKEEIYKNIHIIRFGLPKSENVVSTLIFLPFILRKYLKRMKPDILFEDMSVVPFFTPLLYPKQKKVVMVHGLNGKHFFSSQRFPYSLFGYMGEKLLFIFYRKETIITVSKWVCERLLRYGFKNVHTVLNGVDEFFFQNKKNYTPRPTILFLGRIEGRKGVDLLLRTFPFVEEKVPSVRYIIAGRRFYFGEPKWLKKTLDYFQDHYSNGKIEFTGYVSEEKKQELMSTAWLFAVPSLTEGYGIVALEANATGTFVIANDVEGLQEVVKNNETGILTDCYNPHHFAKSIIEQLNVQKLIAHESACRAWAKTHSWEKSAVEIEQLLSKESRV